VALSKTLLGDFEQITIKPQQATAEKVTQGVHFVSKKNKIPLLVRLLQEQRNNSVLVFSRTKHGANKIVKKLGQASIEAAAIHGNKSQTARQKALGNFKTGKLNVLVATDIAARGIDVDELALVINYDLPNVPETYVPRIGRTGRASASGMAISFCDAEERAYLKDIEKLIKQQVPRLPDHPFQEEHDVPTKEVIKNTAPKERRRQNRNRNRRRNQSGGNGPKNKRNSRS